MIQRDYLILGAGLAGAAVCEGIRQFDAKKTVTLVGAEASLPYHRPPLSKKFLSEKRADPESVLKFDQKWFLKNKIELRLRTQIRAFNAERHLAVLESGETIEFKKACLCTGSRAMVPPVAGATLGNVVYLRTLRDALAVREMAASSKSIVVIGGGFIAVEAAASLAQAGHGVTLMNRDATIWNKWLDRDTSQWLTDYVSGRGLKLRMHQDLKGFEGMTVLKNVATKQGERFPVNLALVAVGAQPNLELFLSTPLHSPNGTPVNEYLETDEKGIFAAGDIALFPDRIYGGARRIEHWDNALRQGQIAGMNLTGKKRQRFDYIPYFFSEIYDLSLEFYGDFSRPPSLVQIEGKRDSTRFTLRYTELGKLRGAVLCNAPKAAGEAIEKEIRASFK